jgi:hypothetical protein
VGGSWSAERLRASGALSYFSGRDGDREEVGYDGEVEFPVAGLLVRGTVSRAPALPEDPVTESIPIYVSDGLAAARQAGVGVEGTAGGTTTYARYSEGEACGNLGLVRPFGTFAVVLEPEKVRFRTGSVGVRIAATRTDVGAHWRQTLESGVASGASVAERSFLEVRLGQDLLRPRSGETAWRVLLVGRRVRETSAPWTMASRSGREISTGVSVAF